MKLWQCDWVPSSVADWLCRELDERGIPGTTYTHTLLSLLHPYFCPHPVPKESGHLPKGFINFDCVSSFPNSGPPHEFEVLFESLEDHVHPDADFPELRVSESFKEGSRRHKKRQKRKIQQLSHTPEKLWKVVALQCLLSASDEPNNLESVIEELFLRLEETQNLISEKEEVKLVCIAEEENSKSVKSDICSTESDLNERCYSSNFPPLSSNKTDKETIEDLSFTLNWKSLIKEKLSPEKNKSPVKECSQPNISEKNGVKGLLESLNKSVCTEGKQENLEMEIRTNSFENGTLENKAYCFIPIFREESEKQHPEIEVSDGSVLQSIESKNREVTNPREKEKLEEWECAGSFLAEPIDRAVSVDVLGNRLYERSQGSADATRCNSNTDFNTINIKNEDEKNQEFKIDNPLTSVWDLPESWKKQQSECGTIWNSSNFDHQSYNNSSNSNLDHLNSGLSIEVNYEGKALSNKSELDIHSKNPLTDSWPPPNQNWNSLPLIDPKIDPVFSSAFHCSPNTVYSEVIQQDSKIPIPQISNENLKNIWSDFNDNITTNSEVESTKIDGQEHSPIDLINFSQIDVHDDNSEEKLCKSFRQLGLEQLWQDPMMVENYPEESRVMKGLSSESSSVTFFDDQSKSEREQISVEEELYKMKLDQNKEVDDRFLLPKIPSGPSGPYIDLRHTETSGFSAVIPHEKNVEDDSESVCEQGGSLPITPKGLQEDSQDRNLTTQDEENLLTSPRTHFRPIRQDSHGSIDDSSKSEDAQAVLNAVTNIKDPNLVFQRSGSGTLYLESDLLKGSPKKYMAYREPPAKAPNITSTNDSHEHPTLPVSDESPTTVFVPKFKIVNNEKFCQTEGPEVSAKLGKAISKELDSKVLETEIQKYDYMYQNPEQPWIGGPYPNNIKLIWGEEPTKSNTKEAWELELGGPTKSYPKWSTHDLSQTDWSNNCQVQLPMQDSANKSIFKQAKKSKSQLNSSEDTLSKIKFIWHNSKDKSGSKIIGSSTSISAVNPSSEFLQSGTFSESWDDQQSKDNDSRAEIPSLSSSLVIPKSPWNIELGLEKDEKDFKSLKQGDPVDFASRWQLQWEVDQEADEILGGLLPPSPLKSSPPYESPLKNQGVTQTDIEEFSFLDFLECQDQQQPIEDLDNLEPGWDLNEGFEWGPASEDIFQGDDDDGNGREVLIYENEDGQTVMLPVEYLDDSLYDQIFGSIDTPIGGSLPDLPGGQMSEFKKGTLSYKLSRRSRGEKFVPPSRRPCSFFLEGNCRRSDCKFSHDLLTITCRFWEEGSCLKGDNCPFRHGFLPSRRRNRSEGDQASMVPSVSFASLKEGNSSVSKGKPIPRKNRSNAPSVSSFELDSETDFPCLGSSVESKIGSLDEQSFPSNIKVTRLSKKKKKYITLTKNVFKEMESDRAKGSHGKGSRRSKATSRSSSFESVSGAVVTDGAGGACSANNGCVGGKKKSKEKGKDRECETLRKVLRKRYPVPPQHPFSHEDGTLSDF